jgi:hypothetical protein
MIILLEQQIFNILNLSPDQKVLISKGSEADFEFIGSSYRDAPMSQSKFDMTDKFAEFLSKISDLDKIKRGVDYII